MSIDLMRKVFQNEKIFTNSTDVFILVCLADWCNDEGLCWPKIKTIARKTRLSTRTIYTKLNEFEKRGWIKRENREGESNRYVLFIQGEVASPEPDSVGSRTDFTPSVKNHQEPSVKQEDKKERKPRSRDLIHDALVSVTNYSPGSFNGLVTSKLRRLNPAAGHEWIAAEIERRFSLDGLWGTNDWRGREGQTPTPMQVFQCWDKVLLPDKKVNQGITAQNLRDAGL